MPSFCGSVLVLFLLFTSLIAASIYLYVTKPLHHWYPATILNTSACHCVSPLRNVSAICMPQGSLTYAYTIRGEVYQATWEVTDERTPPCVLIDCCYEDAQKHRGYWFLATDNSPQQVETVYNSSISTATLDTLTLNNWTVVAYFIFSIGLAGTFMIILTVILFRREYLTVSGGNSNERTHLLSSSWCA